MPFQNFLPLQIGRESSTIAPRNQVIRYHLALCPAEASLHQWVDSCRQEWYPKKAVWI